MTNTKPTATSRLKQDYMRLQRDPVPYIKAEPLPSNILEWHYVIKGPDDSAYCGGFYHGSLLFSKEFPFKPPSIYMFTPNGRFKTNKRLCLSISDFHPDTWNPAWSVATILTGLLSFMLENTPTLGSCETSVYEKKKLAQNSLEFNLKNETFKELFPDVCKEINERIKKIQELKKLNNKDVNLNNNTNNSNKQLDSMDEFAPDGRISDDQDINSMWYSILSNSLVLICFVLFGLVVHYVIKNI